MKANDTTSTSLVIKEHDFQVAKNSLKKYAVKSNSELSLPSVPSSGGLFGLGDHKVTGDELNRVTSQIQEYFIDINKLAHGLVGEFGQVYKAFESLDKDYISGIVGSIKAAEKVSIEEQKDRADIRKIVDRLDKSVEVLKKFKKDIDKLKHITDVDKAWELISNQKQVTSSLLSYKDTLSNLSHLMDADIIWEDVVLLKAKYAEIGNNVSEISTLIQGINSSIAEIQTSLAEQQAAQQAFEAKIEEEITVFYSSVEQKHLEQSDVIHDALETTKAELTERFNALSQQQEKQNLDAQKTQADELARISQEQTSTLEAMSKAQNESMASVVNTLETEKALLQETVEMMKQRLKTAYIIAGSAAVLTTIHLVLNIIGVL